MASRSGPGSAARCSGALCLVSALTLAGCSTDTDIGPGPVAAVRIVPESLQMALGTVDTLHGFGLDATGALLASRTVTWNTSNPAIATVGTSGIVTGAGLGLDSIIASLDGFADTAFVQVAPPPPP
jgi:uncharacterized protein YjdB